MGMVQQYYQQHMKTAQQVSAPAFDAADQMMGNIAQKMTDSIKKTVPPPTPKSGCKGAEKEGSTAKYLKGVSSKIGGLGFGAPDPSITTVEYPFNSMMPPQSASAQYPFTG